MTITAAVDPIAPASPVPVRRRRAPLAPFNGYAWFGVQVVFAGLMTIGHWQSYEQLWLVALAVPLSGIIVGVPLSARFARTVIGRATAFAWIGVVLLVGTQIQGPVGELSVLWPVPAASLAMGLLAMVGRTRIAWTVTLLVVIQSILWGVSRGLLNSGPALELTGAVAAPMAGTIYRVLMRKSQRHEIAARQEEAAALELIARMASQVEARWEYRTRLLGQVGPLLERVASGEELTSLERAECRQTEASLRDVIRGRGLDTDEVLAAARAARERGANVTLIDDRRVEVIEEICRKIVAATCETLAEAEDGDIFVARVLPVGRRNVATVLLVNSEGEGVRREFTMPPSGNVADGAYERPRVELT